jgi:PEP-CTERM motif
MKTHPCQQPIAAATVVLVLALAAPGAGAATLIDEGFASVSDLAAKGWVITNASQPPGVTAGWYQGDGNVFPAQNGDAEAYVAANYANAADGGTLASWLISPVFSTAEATTIGFYARSDASGTFNDQLRFGLNNGTSSSITSFALGSAFTIPTTGWRQYTVLNAARGAGTQARFAIAYVGSADTSSYVGVDSFVVTTPVPEPTAWAMMGLGLVGIAALRKRSAR